MKHREIRLLAAHCMALWLASSCAKPRIQTPSPSSGSVAASERRGPAPAAPDDGSNRIVNLFDAFGTPPPGAEHAFGFSALVRYAGKTILFDAGSSADVLEKNVNALGIDLRRVDFAVASHSHFDHTSGFDYLVSVNPRVKIYFPDDIFWGAPFEYDASGKDPEAPGRLPPEQRYFSGKQTRFQWTSSGRFWKANVEYVKQSSEIAPGVHLIATRSPFVGYFSRYPNVGGHGRFQGEGDTKFVELPELSLTVNTKEGEVLIVGCSHSMVDVIARETKAVLKHDLYLVYGGFHLLPYGPDEIHEIVRRLRDELAVANVAPAHCTGHLGFDLFRQAYGEHYRFAGLGTSVLLPPAP